MADSSVSVTAGSGTSVDTRTESTNGNHRAVVVLGDPSTNAGVAPVDATAGLKVDLGTDNDVTITSGSVTVTQGTATNLKAQAENYQGGTAVGAANPLQVSLANHGANATAVKVDGSAVTQPVSGTVAVSTINSVAPAFGSGVRGATVQRVTIATDDVVPAAQSGTWTVQPGNTANTTAWKVDGSAVTQPVSMATNQPVGTVAHDGVDSGNPVKIGAKAVATPSTATMVASADRTDVSADLDGAVLTRDQFALSDLLAERTSNTDGASTAFSTFGATASTRNYVTAISLFNSSATAGYVDFRDGTAGSILYSVALPAGGGAVMSGNLPLFRTSVNTALAFDVSAALTTVYISISGFKSKV